MSAVFIAFVIAAGGGGWIFSKLQQRTGYGNNGNAVKGALVAAVIIFVLVYTIARMLSH